MSFLALIDKKIIELLLAQLSPSLRQTWIKSVSYVRMYPFLKHLNSQDAFHLYLVNWNSADKYLLPHLKHDIFYLDKLHFVETGNFFIAKSVYISVKSRDGFQNEHQLNKTYKSVTGSSLNNVDFPTLTLMSPRKSVFDCISVSSY